MSIEEEIVYTRTVLSQQLLNERIDQQAQEIAKQYNNIIDEIEKNIDVDDISDEQLDNIINIVANSDIKDEVAAAFASTSTVTLQTTAAIISQDGAYEGFNAITLSPNQLKGIALNETINGKTLEKSIKSAMLPEDRTKQIVRQGRLEGKNPKQVNRELFELLTEKPTYNQINRIDQLTRDYSAYGSTLGRELTYKENESVIKKYKQSAVLENSTAGGTGTKSGRGTCQRCSSLDGTLYNKDESMPPIPLHSRCRCIKLPITKTQKEMGIDNVDEMEDDYRRFTIRDLEKNNYIINNRKVLQYGTTTENYADFQTNELNENQQNSAIGKTRADQIRSGYMTYDDNVNKKTGDLFTLKELEAKYNINNK